MSSETPDNDVTGPIPAVTPTAAEPTVEQTPAQTSTQSSAQTSTQSSTPRFGARLRVSICPADAGRRLSLRYRLPGLRLPGQTGETSEVVGVLDSWDGDGVHGLLTLRRRDGSVVRISRADVLAARVVPPEISAYEMQRIAEQGWPPAEAESLGEWTLRWSGGVSGRANSVRVGGSPGMGLELALTRVRRWYEQRGGRPLLQVPTPSGWDERLDDLGWPERRRTLVQTASLIRLLAVTAPARARTDLRVALLDQPTDAWTELMAQETPDQAAALVEILTRPRDAVFAHVHDAAAGELVAIGRATLQGAWAGLSSLEVRPDARRRGLGTAAMGALAVWATEHNAQRWYLQVFHSNEAALALYDQLGFVTHHAYVYRGPQG